MKEAKLTEEAEAIQKKILSLKEAVGNVVFGQEELIQRCLIALLAEGHLLLEGNPGLAKTLAAKTFASCLSATYQRVQFTPDLLPQDLIGTEVYNPQERTFSIKKGPIFTEILLGDEINRAPPKVQSALLEVMAEKQVTIGTDCTTLGSLFMVIATQNPLEQEGTYPLPEAQVDRFLMKLLLTYPSEEEEKRIMEVYSKKPTIKQATPLSKTEIEEARSVVQSIYIDPLVQDYILRLVRKTREKNQRLNFGASPRASIALMKVSRAFAFLEGRSYVTPHDVKLLAKEVLRHRVQPSYEAEAEEMGVDTILDELIEQVAVP